jgi:pyruvate-formate lyase-activating enzyme
MEALPFYHAEPGTPAIQIGTKGCNASCDYCINAHLAIKEYDNPLSRYEPPDLIAIAKDRLASSINFGINEVTVFLPSAIEVAKAARQADLLTGCLTNGFMTGDSANELAKNMDMINVSLKSMKDSFYKENLGLPSVTPILRNIKFFKEHTHVEIITPITQEIGIDELNDMMDFIEELDPEIPWNLFRLFRTHQRVNEKGKDFNETIEFIKEARRRLPYTYFSNFPGSKWVDTCCPECDHRVIRRISIGACGAKYLSDELTDKDCCPVCGYKISILRKMKEVRK